MKRLKAASAQKSHKHSKSQIRAKTQASIAWQARQVSSTKEPILVPANIGNA